MDLRDTLVYIGFTATMSAITIPIVVRKRFEVLQAHKPELAAAMTHDWFTQAMMSGWAPVVAFAATIAAFVALGVGLFVFAWTVEQIDHRRQRA